MCQPLHVHLKGNERAKTGENDESPVFTRLSKDNYLFTYFTD